MKLILRLIGLKMSILRVDAAIINPKTVKPNLYPSRIIVGTDVENARLVKAAHTFAELLQEGANAIIGGTIYYEYDRSLIWYAGGEFIKDTALTIHCRYNEHMMKNTLSSRDVTFITGCLMLIPKEVISKVGLLPEEHFLYFEDADYCCSALEKNIRLLYCSTAVIYHKVNASAKTNSPVQNYYMVRNGLYMVRKYSHHKWKGYARIFRKEAKRCLRKSNSFKMLCISTYDFLMGRQGKATF